MTRRAVAVGLSAFTLAALGCDDATSLDWAGAVVRPASLDFGTVPMGHAAVRTVTIANPLPHALALGSPRVVPSDAPFLVAAAAIVAPPSAETTLEVRFAPEEVGDQEASLVLVADGTRELAVPLRGRGVDRTLRLEGDGACVGTVSQSFGVARPGEHAARTVRLVVEGEGTVSIERAEVEGPFALDTTLPASASAADPLRLELSFRPERSERAVGRLQLETSAGEKVTLDLCAEATRARLCIEPRAIDFGEIPAGDPRSFSVGVVSCGEDDVTGLEARVAGGESLSIGTLPRLLSAGTSTTLNGRVVLDALGGWRGRIDVIATLPESPVAVDVIAEGFPKCDLEVVPAALYLFKRGYTLPSYTHPVLIRNRASSPCELSEITSGVPKLFRTSAEVEPPSTLLGGELYEVGVHLPQAYDRAFSDALRIRARGDQTWSVEVHANVAPSSCEVLARPQFVDLGFVAPGTTSTRTIELELMAGGQVCPWQTATLPADASPALSVETRHIEPWLLGSVVVTYAPTREEVLETFVELKVDGVAEPVRLPVRGEALAPRLEVVPTAIDFGPTSGVAERAVEVAAVGPEPVTITRASYQPVSPEISWVEPLPIRLEPGERRSLHVRYAPRDPFADRTSLVIWSDHRSRPHTIIPVTGRPTDPGALEVGALYLERLDPASGQWNFLRFARPDAAPTEIAGRLPGAALAAASVSPDGRYVAFQDPTAQYPAPLLVRDLVEGTVRETTIVGAWGAVSWRPDVHSDPPHQFVFTGADFTLQIGTPELGFVRTVGAVDPEHVPLQPAWGAGGKIAFVRTPRGAAPIAAVAGPSDLAWVDELGGSVTNIEFASGGAESREDPSFDPSGQWLVYSTRVGNVTDEFEIRAVRVDGNGPSVPIALPEPRRERPWLPSWAPSGRFVTFVARYLDGDFANDDLFIAAFDLRTGLAGPAVRIDELSTSDHPEGRLVWRPEAAAARPPARGVRAGEQVLVCEGGSQGHFGRGIVVVGLRPLSADDSFPGLGGSVARGPKKSQGVLFV